MKTKLLLYCTDEDENKAKVIYTYDGSLRYVWYELQDDKWVVVYE